MPKSLRQSRTDIPVCLRSCFPQSSTDIPVCLSSSFPTNLLTPGNPSLNPAQAQNYRRHQSLHSDQSQGMCQVLRKKNDQGARYSQISQRHALEHPASSPRCSQFPGHQLKITSSPKFNGGRSVASLEDILTQHKRVTFFSILISCWTIHVQYPDFADTTCASCRVAFGFCFLCKLCELCVEILLSSHRKTGHPFREAICIKSLDGFTAAGLPTASSIHQSLALSPYAKHRSRSKSASAAIRPTARAFASPNIASPTIRPVHRSCFSSSRVAQTRTLPIHPRAPSSASSTRAARSANGSSVPLTITTTCPHSACHATRSIASG